jgi:hypothetical protein
MGDAEKFSGWCGKVSVLATSVGLVSGAPGVLPNHPYPRTGTHSRCRRDDREVQGYCPSDARRADGRNGERDWPKLPRLQWRRSRLDRPYGCIGADVRVVRIRIDTYPCDREVRDVGRTGS